MCCHSGTRGNGEPNASDFVIKNYRPSHPRGVKGGCSPHNKLTQALGGRSLTLYCMSNARSAVSTESPSPTIPSPTLGPSSAIQSPLRTDKLGRCCADGLWGCAT